MYVSALEVEGHRDGPPRLDGPLGTWVDAPKGPVGFAMADALELVSSWMDGDRLLNTAVRLGWVERSEGEVWRGEDGSVDQLSWPDPGGIAGFVDVSRTRQLTIAAHLQLDPPLFGRLRDLALREPRLVSALSGSPTIGVKLGLLLTRSLQAGAPSLLRFSVGGVGFPVQGAERPTWAAPLIADVFKRIHRVDPQRTEQSIAEALHAASLSADPAVRSRFESVRRVLESAPFGLGRLELVRVGKHIELRFGDTLRPLRSFGRAGLECLQLVEAVELATPDVLVVEAPGRLLGNSEGICEWLRERTTGDDAVLEQVWAIPGGVG